LFKSSVKYVLVLVKTSETTRTSDGGPSSLIVLFVTAMFYIPLLGIPTLYARIKFEGKLIELRAVHRA